MQVVVFLSEGDLVHKPLDMKNARISHSTESHHTNAIPCRPGHVDHDYQRRGSCDIYVKKGDVIWGLYCIFDRFCTTRPFVEKKQLISRFYFMN